ncbi:hypothetical protein PanWU01x14_038410, partial [Parasponia andersonii]
MRASGRIKPLKQSTGFATIWENGKIHFSILNMLPMVSSKTPVGNLLTCCLVCLSVPLGLIAFFGVIADNRDRPGLSSDQLARVYAINELPVEEFNWKVLGTTKNLVACGLIPKGAAFPDPPVVPSRPTSSKRKSKKSDLGASSSRTRKRKAPSAPPRTEPSSPETESPPAPRPPPQEEGNRTFSLTFYILSPRLLTVCCAKMVIGSGLRAPPSTLGSMAKTKTPESMPLSKGKEKVDCSKKRKVIFEDVPASSPPPPSQPASTSIPPTEAATSEPIPVDKDNELFALLDQLPERVGMSAAFIDRFTSDEGWERLKRRSAKVAFGSAMRML